MQLIERTVFCLLAASLWTGISAAEPLPEESMNVVSLEFIAIYGGDVDGVECLEWNLRSCGSFDHRRNEFTVFTMLPLGIVIVCV